MRTFPTGPQLVNPYPFFAEMRQHNPIVFDETAGVWSIYRHDHVSAALSDHERFASSTAEQNAMPEAARRRFASLVAFDPPRHTQMRKLVSRAFTPAAVAKLEARIGQIVDALIDPIAPAGTTELVADIAAPLPTIVIAEMLGVPAEDRAEFGRWSNAIGEAANATVTNDPAAGFRRLVAAYTPMENYLRKIIDERRRRPADDLITALIGAEIDGEHLEELDLVAFCVILLLAGNITTTHFLGNCMLALIHHPDARAQLIAEPERTPTAVEELLRYDSPLLSASRYIAQDFELDGHQLRKGQRAILWCGAANRDPEVFADPDRLDLDRKPTRHMSFGQGVHYCLGAPLARLEVRIALPRLLARLPDFQLADGTVLEAAPGYFLHGLQRLPLVFRQS